MKTQIITAAVQKGGVGKTTTAAVLAQAAAFRGKKVLAIDMDPQGNLSYALAADDSKKGTLAFMEGADPEEVLQHSPQGLDVIPAEWDLAAAATSKGSALRLKKALEPLKGKYDLIMLDVPSKAGELQYNALQASTGLIIPLLADGYSMKALFRTIKTAIMMQSTNEDLEILGIMFSMYDGRTNIAKALRDQVIEYAGSMDVPYLGTVRKGIAVQEAAAMRQSLFEYDPKGKPAQDFLSVLDKLNI